MPKQSDITIIVPAFNEAGSISSVVTSLRRELPDAEIFVVNDGSTDGTGPLAEAAGARILTHRVSRGYGASLKTGIRTSERDYVMFCDGDGQHSAEDCRRLIDSIGDADMAIGERDRTSHREWVRRPGKFILGKFANYLAGERIPDLTSGLRLMRRDMIRRYLHLMPKGFSFSATSTLAVLKSDHEIRWVPITALPRSGQSTVRQWRDGPQALMLILRLTILFEPLKVFLTVDAGLLVLSLVSFGIDVWVNERFGVGDVTVALSIATLTVFLFGLVCDQVSALRREIHD